MTTTALHCEFDPTGYRHALEERDVAMQLAHYTECADVFIVNQAQPASPVRALHGRGEVASWLTELRSTYSDISTVTLKYLGADVLLIAECRRPDADLDVYAATTQLKNGLIARQYVVML